MSRPRSRVVDYLVYVLVRFFICIIQVPSLHAACSLADFLSWLACLVDRRHYQVALDNLRQAFPNRYNEAELNLLVRATYRHFCTLLIEIMHIPRKVHPHNCEYHWSLGERRQLILDLLNSKRPLLFITGHFGNWELAGYGLGVLGFKTHAVARPIDNPLLDGLVQRFREGAGQKIFAKRRDLDRVRALLAGGGKLATLVDQDAGPRGVFVSFFGRHASTNGVIARLALEHRVPMMVVGIPRVAGPLRYQVAVEDVIWPEEYEGCGPEAVRAVTQRFMAGLERVIRRHPEQYLWLHRRWKHQPDKARRKRSQAA
jgi:KDO2-lipid IV(A) lauroyltransferase